MLGVDTDAEALVSSARVDQRLNLVEAPPDRPASSGGVLNEDGTVFDARWRWLGGVERTFKGLGDLLDDRLETGTEV